MFPMNRDLILLVICHYWSTGVTRAKDSVKVVQKKLSKSFSSQYAPSSPLASAWRSFVGSPANNSVYLFPKGQAIYKDKVKSASTPNAGAKWIISAAFNKGFISMKRAFQLHLDGMVVHRRVTLSTEFVIPHFYTWVERGTVRFRPQLHGLGYPRQPSPVATLSWFYMLKRTPFSGRVKVDSAWFFITLLE